MRTSLRRVGGLRVGFPGGLSLPRVPLVQARCLSSNSSSADTPQDDVPFTSSFNVPPPATPTPVVDITDKYLNKMANLAEQLQRKPILLKGIKYDGTTKRFYEQVGVVEAEKGFALTLGGRLVHTNTNQIVSVPSRPLAHAIAHEWDSQITFVKPHTMPLMHLATLAIDQVPLQRESMVSNMLGYIHTDSACIRDTELQSLTRLQRKHWDPVVEWMKAKHDMSMEITPENTPSIFIVQQSPETVQKMESLLDALTDWQLATLDSLTAISKSLIVSLAIMGGQLDVKRGYECCRLEENYQMRRYGRVDGLFGHGIDIEYVRMKIAAARTFLNLLELTEEEFASVVATNSTQEEEKSKRDLDSMVREYDMS